MITTSLDWTSHELALKVLYQTHVPPKFHDDAFHLIKNVGNMITTLSKLEVSYRNTPFVSIKRNIDQLVEKINNEIDMLEQNATILVLCG